MTKVVLKKSEILKSARPIVIQPFDEKIQAIPLENLYESNQSKLDMLLNNLDDDSLDHMEDSLEGASLEVPISNSIDTENPLDNEVNIQKAQDLIDNAQNESDRIISSAQDQKEDIIKTAQKEAQDIRDTIEQELQKAKDSGKKEGLQEGLDQAQTENKRLVQLLQKISVDLVNEKSKILDTIESEIVDLILMISSKVVKSITAQYKQVVFDNVSASIKKLKVRNDLLIKVNPDDLYTIETYKTNILNDINGIENIQFLEDPTIEQGGCIIQSDFGSVDGRISSQLAEIEEQIRKISPIKPL